MSGIEDTTAWKEIHTFHKGMTESANEVLPKVELTYKKKWMTADILQKMKDRRIKGNNILYSSLDKEILLCKGKDVPESM